MNPMHVLNAHVQASTRYQHQIKEERSQHTRLDIAPLPNESDTDVNNEPANIDPDIPSPLSIAYSEEEKNILELLDRMFGLRASKQHMQAPTLEKDKAEIALQNIEAQGLGFRFTMDSSYTYHEYERSDVYFSGDIQLADGTAIAIDLQSSLEREVYVHEQVSLSFGTLPVDPLVLAVEASDVGFSNQRTDFDLNADGSIDSMATLNAGSYFLSLDKNNNGRLDDGSELFGPQTGQGFQELAAYDQDQNGFIDAADDIYASLRLSTLNTDGSQHHFSLAEKNIGAIATHSIDQQFQFNTNNEQLAQLKRSSYAVKDGAALGQIALVREVDFFI